MARRICLGLLTCLALVAALPAASVAQDPGVSAGDQQYTDPLAGTTTPPSSSSGSSPSSSGSSSGNGSSSASSSSGSSDASASAAPAPSATSSATPSPSSASTGRTLPYTGLPTGLALALGAALIAAGMTLRRATSPPA